MEKTLSANMLFMETDELQEYLNALGRSDNYRVDAVLSDAPHERTERVFYVGNNGSELGPFIRKTIATDSGQGRTYEKIFRAQHEGKRFVHMPRIFECYVADSSLVVLLEYVEGETLQDYVGERGASYELALRIFPPICDAASELHKAFDPPAHPSRSHPGEHRCFAWWHHDHRPFYRTHIPTRCYEGHDLFRYARLCATRAVRLRPDRCA